MSEDVGTPISVNPGRSSSIWATTGTITAYRCERFLFFLIVDRDVRFVTCPFATELYLGDWCGTAFTTPVVS